MRIYEISRSLRGIVRCMVHTTEGQGETLPRKRLPHANLHSPTGFECGYGGSGPADLAASILADFFNISVRAVGRAWRGKGTRRVSDRVLAERVIRLHEHFKAAVIGGIHIGKGESVKLSSDQIAEWLVIYERDEANKAASA